MLSKMAKHFLEMSEKPLLTSTSETFAPLPIINSFSQICNACDVYYYYDTLRVKRMDVMLSTRAPLPCHVYSAHEVKFNHLKRSCLCNEVHWSVYIHISLMPVELLRQVR